MHSNDEMSYHLEDVQSQRDESPFKKVQSVEQRFLECHLNCESVDIGSEDSIRTITFKAQVCPKPYYVTVQLIIINVPG